MTPIVKALVIREPWIDLILSGAKAWEMRGGDLPPETPSL